MIPPTGTEGFIVKAELVVVLSLLPSPPLHESAQ